MIQRFVHLFTQFFGHVYVSTACAHGLHAECRRECKFCPAKCRCACHAQAMKHAFSLSILGLLLVSCAAVGNVGPQEPASRCDFKDESGWWHGHECPPSQGGGCCGPTESCVMREQKGMCLDTSRTFGDFVGQGALKPRRWR